MQVMWWMPSSFTRLPPGPSDGLGHTAALEAARADVCPSRRAVEQDADALEVRVEAPLGGDHRVASVVAEAGLLRADDAHSRHAENPFRGRNGGSIARNRRRT